MVRDEYVYKGRVYHRVPGSALFVAVTRVVIPCPGCSLHPQPALEVTSETEERLLERLMSAPLPFLGRIN